MGIKALYLAAQLLWTGRVFRMNDGRITRKVSYSKLLHCYLSNEWRKRYKDELKANLKSCEIRVSGETWSMLLSFFQCFEHYVSHISDEYGSSVNSVV